MAILQQSKCLHWKIRFPSLSFLKFQYQWITWCHKTCITAKHITILAYWQSIYKLAKISFSFCIWTRHISIFNISYRFLSSLLSTKLCTFFNLYHVYYLSGPLLWFHYHSFDTNFREFHEYKWTTKSNENQIINVL